MSLAERVSTARNRLGINQSELGRRANITPAGVSQIEAGKRQPTSCTLERLARCLGVTADWLLGLDPAPDNEMIGSSVHILYVNHRGETWVRHIQPIPPLMWYGSTDWHPEPQWFLHAFDLEKREERDFAVRDIRAWF
jgi:transcriptional regulator with XRE-family HTH domain